MQAAPPAISVFLAACLCLSPLALAQQPLAPAATESSALPSAPIPQFIADASSAALPQTLASPTSSQPVPPGAAGLQPATSLTLGDRFALEAHITFGPAAFVVPAGEAATTMAIPPHDYPRAWRDGGGAFGRNYGAEFVRHTTGGLAHFATAAVLREDPRYHPSTSTNFGLRFAHALTFTLIDETDSGRHTIAFSNLAGSAAAGFISMAYYPDGFNDTTHAYQRAAVEVTTFGAHNVIAEFAPELVHLAHIFHFPDRIADSFLPPDRK